RFGPIADVAQKIPADILCWREFGSRISRVMPATVNTPARTKPYFYRLWILKVSLKSRSCAFLSACFYWRSLGDSNPCFRRERATSWAARRRELRPRNSLDRRSAQARGRPRIIQAPTGLDPLA